MISRVLGTLALSLGMTVQATGAGIDAGSINSDAVTNTSAEAGILDHNNAVLRNYVGSLFVEENCKMTVQGAFEDLDKGDLVLAGYVGSPAKAGMSEKLVEAFQRAEAVTAFGLTINAMLADGTLIADAKEPALLTYHGKGCI